ncbi:hypothetical protein D5086_028446 [Populus alba]|uniref:Uncharacterized protein n=1 Tax=Populus alba TaxID=43335 RepID=A0ACC4AY65_POPAL
MSISRHRQRATPEQAHAVFSNLGNFYWQLKRYARAPAMFTRALELSLAMLRHSSIPGLVFVAKGSVGEGQVLLQQSPRGRLVTNSNIIERYTLIAIRRPSTRAMSFQQVQFPNTLSESKLCIDLGGFPECVMSTKRSFHGSFHSEGDLNERTASQSKRFRYAHRNI